MAVDFRKLDSFAKSYIEAFLTSLESDGENKDKDRSLTYRDLGEGVLEAVVADCEKFQELAGDMISEDNLLVATQYSADEMAGYDFWQTRSEAGVGFWDGDWKPGVELTALVKEHFKRIEPYFGDDGKVYLM